MVARRRHSGFPGQHACAPGAHNNQASIRQAISVRKHPLTKTANESAPEKSSRFISWQFLAHPSCGVRSPLLCSDVSWLYLAACAAMPLSGSVMKGL
jgi:hypothetical protein